MEITLIIGILGLLATGAQWVRARRAEEKHQQLLERMPERIASELERIIGSAPHAEEEAALRDEGSRLHRVRYADVTNDGEQELLVEYLTGAHGLALKVFGWQDMEFREIGHLSSTAPEPFEIDDFDGDGRIELQTYQVDWSVGLPYVTAPRERVTYRWEQDEFQVVKREKDYTPEELAELRRKHKQDRSQ